MMAQVLEPLDRKSVRKWGVLITVILVKNLKKSME